uniref:conjugal transfer protein TraW n=1 Tax=Cupriavidus gilardii TaxID=82541 RepID=UPI00247AFD1E|nr:conjugal transfer protein TraW [Cupriavidus gilardii]WDE72560.1 IncI1 plasmid conjugative transfer protein TraW [Cupriavidus gilardii]
MKRKLLALSAVIGAITSPPAFAVCDGCVVGAVQAANATITAAVAASATTISTAINLLSTNLANVGSKVSDAVVQSANQQRELQIETQRRTEKERVERETELPIDPCSNSSGNYASQATTATGGKSSGYKRGGGGGSSVSSPVLNKALNDPFPSPEVARRQSHAIHMAKYCNAVEQRLGYAGCSGSSMPDADANVESILTGAGKPGKDPELTFTTEQEEAARAYARLSLDPHPPQNITKAEAATEQGKSYIALQKMYQANMSAAEKIQFDLIAARMPFPGSNQLVQEIKKADHAAKYFDMTASRQAKNGAMSLAEMMDFESGRRFRNPYWVIAMAAEASPEKLQREMVLMQAYSNELQLQNLRMMEKVGVALGQLLAAQTRAEMRPSIEAQLLRAQSTNAR